MDYKKYLGIIIVVIVYLVLRLYFFNTIEFGYDQPRLATRIVQYIDNKNILETQRFAESSPWGNITWGPSLFFFYSPFFVFIKDPIVISNAIAIFNVLSVVAVYVLGSKFFSKSTGLVAGLMLATHPWWYVFSRMIYQPTPVVTITTLSMFLFFMAYTKPKSFWISLLIFSWVFLVEIYLHSIAFIFVSAVALLLTKWKNVLNKYTFLGILLSAFLIIPYFVNFNYLDYVPKETTAFDGSKFGFIAQGFLNAVSGGSFEYQLGYGSSSFYKYNLIFSNAEKIVLVLSLISVVYVLLSLFFVKSNKFFRTIILFWFFSPILFLNFVSLPFLLTLPRYFLISLPAFVLIWGIFISDMYAQFKKRIVFLVPIMISIYWMLFVIDYENFVKNFDYQLGHLSPYSDTQIYYVSGAIDNAIRDSRRNGFRQTVISNDQSRPKEYALEWGMDYLLKYVYKIDRDMNNNNNKGFYLINYSNDISGTDFTKIYTSGPVSVYKVNN